MCDTLMVPKKDFFKKDGFEKKAGENKTQKNLPSMQSVKSTYCMVSLGLIEGDRTRAILFLDYRRCIGQLYTIRVRKGAKIRNQDNQAPHLIQDTN